MNLTPANSLVATLSAANKAKGARVVSSVVRMLEANARQVLGHTKNRGDVSGGGKKPWKQKGTGRARAGSTRSPLWRKGGTAHGPRSNRNYTLALPEKLKASALGAALSFKAEAGELYHADSLPSDGKTKSLLELASQRTLLVLEETNLDLVRASRNLANLTAKLATTINAKDVLNASRVVGTDEALKALIDRVSRYESRGTKPATTKASRNSNVPPSPEATVGHSVTRNSKESE